MSTIRSSSEHLTLNADGAGKDIILQNNGSTKVTVKSDGKVGVGTSSPISPLDVNGEVRSRSLGFTLIDGTTVVGRLIKHKEISGSGTDNTPCLFSETGLGLSFMTNGDAIERIRITSTGNVGIVNATPDSYYSNSNQLVVGSGAARQGITIASSTTTIGQIAFADGISGDSRYEGWVIYDHNDDHMEFGTNHQNRMTITSTGDVFMGTLSSFASGSRVKQFEVNTSTIAIKSGTSSTSFQYHQEFHNPNGLVGSITTSGSLTSYNTSSDYRLKENVTPMSGSIDRLKALKPSRFNFITDADKTVDGFIAHEAQAIVPECVTGEKDGADMQGIDQAKLVPLLTSALQESITKIEQLESRITTLEAS